MLSKNSFAAIGIVFILFSFLMYSSCGSDDPEPEPLNILRNSEMETGSGHPDSWNFFAFGGGHEQLWVDDEFYSPSRSAGISNITNDTTFAIWAQQVSMAVPKSYDITFEVQIKGVNLEGEGVAIAIRGDDTKQPIEEGQFVTSEDSIKISGTFDWTSYSVEMKEVQDNIGTIYVFLIYLPYTTGTVYFDDATLSYIPE